MALREKDEERRKERGEKLALDWVKQIIPLASGVVAISVTFLEKFTIPNFFLLSALVLTWMLLVLSILFGLITIQNFVAYNLGTLPDWSTGICSLHAMVSKWLFFSGISVFAVFGVLFLLIK